MHLPLFSVDLASDFLLGLAVTCGSDFLVLVDGVVQGVLELVETREHRHGGCCRGVDGSEWGRSAGYCIDHGVHRAIKTSILFRLGQGLAWRSFDKIEVMGELNPIV